MVALLLMLIVSRRQVEMGSMLSPVVTANNNNSNHLRVPLDDAVDPKSKESSAATTNNKPIRQISILGERNSGTRWTFAYVVLHVVS